MSDQDKPAIFKQKSKKVFGGSKKLADFLEEAWKAVQNAFSKEAAAAFGALVTGVTGFFISLADSYIGAKDTYRGYYGGYKSNRKLRTGLGLLMLLTGLIGAGFSLELVIGYCGVEVFAYPFLSVIVSGILLVNSIFGLVRQGFTLHEANRKEAVAKANFENCPPNDENYEQYKQVYQHAIDHRLAAERAMVFKGIEVAATAVLLVASILGTVAIVGAASVASFGIVPLVLTVAAITTIFLVKSFQAADQQEDFYYTKKIRSLFAKEPKVEDHGKDFDKDHDKDKQKYIDVVCAGNTANMVSALNSPKQTYNAGEEPIPDKQGEQEKVMPKPLPVIPEPGVGVWNSVLNFFSKKPAPGITVVFDENDVYKDEKQSPAIENAGAKPAALTA